MNETACLSLSGCERRTEKSWIWSGYLSLRESPSYSVSASEKSARTQSLLAPTAGLVNSASDTAAARLRLRGAGAATSPSSNLLPCFGLPTIILLLCHTESHNKCQKQIFSTLGLSHHENKSLCQSLSSTLSFCLSISVITIHINSYNKNLIQEAYLFWSVHRLPRSRSSRPGVKETKRLTYSDLVMT